MTGYDAPMFHELWDRADPEATGNRFRETLPGVEASADLDLLVQLLTQIARTHSLQMQFPEAHQLLDRAEGLLTPELVVGRIRVLLERGRAFNSANEKEKSRPLFVEAWELASGAGEAYHAADAAHMMGIAGESASVQLDWNLKAMNVAEGSSNPHVRQWLGPLYNNIGWTYHDDGGYAKALDLFQKSLQWREEEAEPRKAVPIRIARWCIARTLRSLGRLEEALARQLALLQEWQEAGGQDGYVVEELAECLLALGREQEARPYFAKAYEQLSQDGWLVANEAARLERLLDLGREEV